LAKGSATTSAGGSAVCGATGVGVGVMSAVRRAWYSW
jgi:hypothetical protein